MALLGLTSKGGTLSYQVSGNTILGDGSVIMILDPNGIGRAAGITGDRTATDTLLVKAGPLILIAIGVMIVIFLFNLGALVGTASAIAAPGQMARRGRAHAAEADHNDVATHHFFVGASSPGVSVNGRAQETARCLAIAILRSSTVKVRERGSMSGMIRVTGSGSLDLP